MRPHESVSLIGSHVEHHPVDIFERDVLAPRGLEGLLVHANGDVTRADRARHLHGVIRVARFVGADGCGRGDEVERQTGQCHGGGELAIELDGSILTRGKLDVRVGREIEGGLGKPGAVERSPGDWPWPAEPLSAKTALVLPREGSGREGPAKLEITAAHGSTADGSPESPVP